MIRKRSDQRKIVFNILSNHHGPSPTNWRTSGWPPKYNSGSGQRADAQLHSNQIGTLCDSKKMMDIRTQLFKTIRYSLMQKGNIALFPCNFPNSETWLIASHFQRPVDGSDPKYGCGRIHTVDESIFDLEIWTGLDQNTKFHPCYSCGWV